MRIFQKGFNYSQNGQGNRLVFHLQGCNMHCLLCTNPEATAFAKAINHANELAGRLTDEAVFFSEQV